MHLLVQYVVASATIIVIPDVFKPIRLSLFEDGEGFHAYEEPVPHDFPFCLFSESHDYLFTGVGVAVAGATVVASSVAF